MNAETFMELTQQQQTALLISMHVRNKLEDFHVEYLSDEQMRELNPIIRQAVFEVLSSLNKTTDADGKFLAWLVQMIPDYWEIPEDKTSG